MEGFFASSTLQKDRPDVGLVAKCGACGLFKRCESPKMPVHGAGKRGVLIVGEAPGEDEDLEGRPFVGRAGQYLREVLDDLGIDLDKDAWTTNALICRPQNSAVPDEKQISYCRPNLAKTIETLSPVVVIALGRVALTSVLAPYWKEIKQMARWTGWQIPLEAHWVCPTYHPSFLLRSKNPMMDRLFAGDLERAFSLYKLPPKNPNLQKKVTRLYEPDEVRDAMDVVNRMGGWVAFDYESNCLKPEYSEAKVYSASFGNTEQAFAYPWTKATAQLTSDFLRYEKTRKIASNAKFEERWTRKMFGHGVSNWGWDTMIAAHVLDNRDSITSLKFQALVKLGIPVYNENIDPYLSSDGDRYNRIQEISVEDLLLYNGMDSILEARLAALQRRELGYED